jgi:dTDP-4-dehydrorhamnose reductase
MKLDLTSFKVVDSALRDFQPDVVIHTVGLTSVDGCEADPSLAYRLNVEAANYTARSARALGAKLVHISTDHLFNGTEPWRREEDAPYPLNMYATTKLQAEEVVLQACPDALVIRTNFFGWGTSIRASFSDWIINSL